jgi:outer membrane usher protein FimD/PapC
VWTDAWGRAVIASLPEYADSRIEVATKSLPRNVDITNGLQMLEAGHGSVNRVDFGVVKVRRALLAARLPDGTPVPKGATVVDADDNFVTAVGEEGGVFLGNGQISSRLLVYLPDGKQCRLDYRLPEKQDMLRYYERAEAVCAM